MKISSQLFLVLVTVVNTVSILGEPCLPGGNGQHQGDRLGYGKYDMPACDAYADNGENKGQCWDAIYRNSLGRDDDDLFHWGAQPGSTYGCYDIGDECKVGGGDCYPGLIYDAAKTCKLPTDNPEAHAASSWLTNSSSTSNTTNGGYSLVLVVVSLLGAAMIAMKVVQRRPRVLLRRQQYSEMDATATLIDVW